MKFFTEVTGKFDAKLEFESFFAQKTYTLSVTGLSDFPQISSLPKNIFYSQKKQRPPTAPESFLNKTFVVSENCFDFGPSVVGKDPQQKEQFNQSNSALFRISNNGKFDCEVSFALMSSVREDAEYRKDVFFFEPERLSLKTSDVPQEIRVWALPQQPQKFRDELIVMVKDNPIPLLLPL